MRSYIATSVGTIAVPLIGNISGPELHFTYFITLIFLPSSYVMLFSFIILYQLSVHLFLTHVILHRILFSGRHLRTHSCLLMSWSIQCIFCLAFLYSSLSDIAGRQNVTESSESSNFFDIGTAVRTTIIISVFGCCATMVLVVIWYPRHRKPNPSVGLGRTLYLTVGELKNPSIFPT